MAAATVCISLTEAPRGSRAPPRPNHQAAAIRRAGTRRAPLPRASGRARTRDVIEQMFSSRRRILGIAVSPLHTALDLAIGEPEQAFDRNAFLPRRLAQARAAPRHPPELEYRLLGCTCSRRVATAERMSRFCSRRSPRIQPTSPVWKRARSRRAHWATDSGARRRRRGRLACRSLLRSAAAACLREQRATHARADH